MIEFGVKGKKKAGVAPSFIEQAAAAPDPLAGVEYTGDREVDSAAELTALQVAHRGRAERERGRFEQATDSEHWVALCFRSRDHKEAFLAAVNAVALGDKYVDGHRLADLMGIDLEV